MANSFCPNVLEWTTHRSSPENVLFLRAQRKARGRRTYKLCEGEPLQTSYGKDVYDEVFGEQLEE